MAATRQRNPRGGGAELRRQLLDAAERILNTQSRRQDLHVSLREVAHQVGVTAPSIYLHFEDKNALAWGLVSTGFAELEKTLREIREKEGVPAVQQLRDSALAYCRFLEDRPGLAQVMFSGDPLRWAPDQSAQHPAAPVMRAWESLVGAAFADAGRPYDDGVAAAAALWSLLHGLVTLSVIYPAQARDRLAVFADVGIPALLVTPTDRLAAFAVRLPGPPDPSSPSVESGPADREAP